MAVVNDDDIVSPGQGGQQVGRLARVPTCEKQAGGKMQGQGVVKQTAGGVIYAQDAST
jgi:hypothetical protein